MRYGLDQVELEICSNSKSRPRGEGTREKTEPWCMVAGPSRVSDQYTFPRGRMADFRKAFDRKVLQTTLTRNRTKNTANRERTGVSGGPLYRTVPETLSW